MLKGINTRFIKVFGIIFGTVILIIILLAIFGNRVISYSKIEERMVSAAKDYYKKNSDLLPSEGNKATVTGFELENGYMKRVSAMVPSGVVCSSEVIVKNVQGTYVYTPYLNCGDAYTTRELYKEITKDSNVVNTSSGLYKVGTRFVYRGSDVNNYVSFGGKTWRIIDVNSNGLVRMIEVEVERIGVWDNKYNVDLKTTAGINIFNDNAKEPSNVLKYLNALIENEEYLTKEAVSKLAYTTVCYGERAEASTVKDNSEECAVTMESLISLPTPSDYLLASLDDDCSIAYDNSCRNYNFFSKMPTFGWSVTAVKGSTSEVYIIGNGIKKVTASDTNTIRTVVSLDSTVMYNNGDGSLNNPYTIK